MSFVAKVYKLRFNNTNFFFYQRLFYDKCKQYTSILISFLVVTLDEKVLQMQINPN